MQPRMLRYVMKRLSRAVVLIGISALAVMLGASRGSYAGNLVQNGGFELYTPGTFTQGDYSYTGPGDLGFSPVTAWSSPAMDSTGSATGNLLFLPGSADTTGTFYDDTPFGGGFTFFSIWGPNNGSNNGLPATSPAGGNFLGLDADPVYSGALSQTITGLTAGQSYVVGFYWAGAQLSTTSGPTTEQVQVTFGSQTQSTAVVNNADEGFTGWTYQTLTFTADGPSDLLSFLAIGTPSGLPPFVLLDGVSLNAVPEPASILLLGVGLLGAISVRRLHRRSKSAGV
jgi:PEP-CTERM motif